ncbi:MAG: NUDIX domain-containing protein [Asgard group archaeon]|nr:NUDIX domain-containing protein [Asgard group archaeon]
MDINYEEIDQVSAGGVVYRLCEDDKIRIALIRDQNTHKWILPKGRIEEGESLEDTSIREVKEETGLQKLKLVNIIDKTNYWFRTEKKERLYKEVHFFLYEDEDGCEDICVEEKHFDKGQWFTKEEAIKKIGFPAQRKILYKAFRMIDNKRKRK